MKVFISADMEGITGTSTWEECDHKSPFYARFAEQMTQEVLAAIEGATAAGATEIVVKDAHASATNIDITQLPENVKLMKCWSGHPYSMVDGIDATFDAVLFVGYHSAAGISGNPLSHTMTGNPWTIKLNGDYASEFMIYSYAAAMEGVPTVFVAGDKLLCEAAQLQHANITTVSVKDGYGGRTISLSPKLALKQIKKQSETALKSDLTAAKIVLPKHFSVEITYKEHTYATRKSFYPGVTRVGSHTLKFETDHYFEVLRLFAFVL